MGKFKYWLVTRFLPAWAKESVYKENQRLMRQVDTQAAEIDRLKAYISGLEYGVKRRVTINNGVSGK